MTPRSIRRAAERKAAKLAKRNPKQGEGQPMLREQPTDRTPDTHREQLPNRSTGPRTPEGKATSCLHNTSAQGVPLPVVRVSTRHGLTGLFRLITDESTEVFEELRDALRAEHQPATATEFILVDRLAEHVWLTQRAQRFQNQAAANGDQSWFALMLRYETTHDRAFHKCLAELRTLRRERQQHPKASAGQFESQKSAARPAEASPTPSTAPTSSAATSAAPACQPQHQPTLHPDVESILQTVARHKRQHPEMFSSNRKTSNGDFHQ